MLRLTIIEEPDGDKPDSATLIVGPGGATVGRTRENTWVLPDHQNLLSRSHFEIVFEDGAYRLLDRSTNGTFINEEKAPMGRGNSASVKEGDVIGLGEYKIEVTLEAIGSEPVPESMLGERPDFFGADSSVTPSDLDTPAFKPQTDSAGFGDLGGIPDAFAAIEAQQIPDGLFGGSAGPDSASNAGLPDRERDRAALSESTDGRLGVNSSFGLERSPEYEPRAGDRPDLFVPMVSTPESAQVPATPYLSMPSSGEGAASQDDNFVAPPPVGVDNKSASGAIPDDWYLESEDPPLAAPVPSQVKPVVTPPPSTPVGNIDRVAVQPQPTAPSTQSPADGNELERGIRHAVSGALGGQAETMKHGDLVRVVEEMSAMVQATTPELMRALNSRTQFKDHMRLDQTMVRAQDNNPLKFFTDPSDALARMLLNDQPGLLQGKLAVAEAFRQLAAHQTALVAALQPALEETVEKFSPTTIEAVAKEEGGNGFSLSSGKGKLWDTYQQVFARLADSDRGRLEEFFMKSLAQHYERSLTTLG